MVFAKEGELRGFLFLLFRFFSGGGCGTCKSSYIKSGGKFSRDAKKFFTVFFWVAEFSFTGTPFVIGFWFLLLFFCFMKYHFFLSLDIVVYS